MNTIRSSMAVVAILAAFAATGQAHAQYVDRPGYNDFNFLEPLTLIELLVDEGPDVISAAYSAASQQQGVANRYPSLRPAMTQSAQLFQQGAYYATAAHNQVLILHRYWDDLQPKERRGYARAGRALAEKAYLLIDAAQRITPLPQPIGNTARNLAAEYEGDWEDLDPLML